MSIETRQTDLVAAGNDSPATSGLGGGPSVHGMCAAPCTADSATPPFVCGPPHTNLEGKPLQTGPGLTFSTKTCFELVDALSIEQLTFEFNLFKSNNAGLAEKCRTRTTSENKMRELLKNALINNVCQDYNAIIQNCNSISDSFSYIADKVEEYVEIIRTQDQHIMPAATPANNPDEEEEDGAFFSPSSDLGIGSPQSLCEPVVGSYRTSKLKTSVNILNRLYQTCFCVNFVVPE